jgi:superfamily II DNA helicase RecQ
LFKSEICREKGQEARDAADRPFLRQIEPSGGKINLGVSRKKIFLKMQIKQFFISMYDNGKASDEMNRFLRGHKILEVREEFMQSSGGAVWCYSIKYQAIYYGTDPVAGGEEKRDYKKDLTPEAFDKFNILRQGRKIICTEDAITFYSAFTDAELAEIAKLDEMNPVKIAAIKGIGEKKLEKYVPRLIAYYHEKSQPLAAAYNGPEQPDDGLLQGETQYGLDV